MVLVVKASSSGLHTMSVTKVNCATNSKCNVSVDNRDNAKDGNLPHARKNSRLTDTHLLEPAHGA